MNIKSLLLGSAAALAVVSGAQAADAIVAAEPEPVEYVRVCDAYGTGYFYIPGTETCLLIDGYIRFQVDVGHEVGSTFASGRHGSDWDAFTRAQLQFTTKSDTEYGTLTGLIALRTNADSPNDDGDRGTGLPAARRLEPADRLERIDPERGGDRDDDYDRKRREQTGAWWGRQSPDAPRSRGIYRPDLR